MGRGAGAKRRGHDGSQTEGERRYEMLAESRNLMARIDAKLQDVVSGPPSLKGSEVYGQQMDTSAALNRSEDSRRELEALLKSVAEAVRPKDEEVLEEPTDFEATEQPFEDGKRAIARAREELMQAASRAKEDVATGASSQRLKETLMETTESLKSKERALADARKRASELKNEASLEKSSADQARKAFATVEEKRCLREGQWLDVVEKYEDTIASLEAERAALDQKLRVIEQTSRDKDLQVHLEGEGGFGAEDSKYAALQAEIDRLHDEIDRLMNEPGSGAQMMKRKFLEEQRRRAELEMRLRELEVLNRKMNDQLAAESRRADELSAKLMFASAPTEDPALQARLRELEEQLKAVPAPEPPLVVETVERGSLAMDNELEICVLRKENADLKASLEKAQQTLAKAQKVLKGAPDAAAAAARDEELERLREELAQAKSVVVEAPPSAAATPVETTGATTPVDDDREAQLAELRKLLEKSSDENKQLKQQYSEELELERKRAKARETAAMRAHQKLVAELEHRAKLAEKESSNATALSEALRGEVSHLSTRLTRGTDLLENVLEDDDFQRRPIEVFLDEADRLRKAKTSQRLEKAERSLQRATMRKTNLAAVFASRLAKKARVSFDDAAAGLEEEDPEVAKRRRIREAILLFAVRLKRMQDLAEENGTEMADIMDVGAPPPKEEEPEVVPKEPDPVEPPPEEVHPSTPPATVGSTAPPNTPFPAVESSEPELRERLSDLEEQLRGAAAAREDLESELAEARRAKDALAADYEKRLAEAQSMYDALVAEQEAAARGAADRAAADLACVSAKDHFLQSCEDAAAAAAAAARERDAALAEARAAAARAEERAREALGNVEGAAGARLAELEDLVASYDLRFGAEAAVVRAKDGELARLAPLLSRAAAEAVVVDAKDAELARAGAALTEARRDAEQAAAELVKARDAAASAAQSEDATEPEAAAPDSRDEELARLRAELAEARGRDAADGAAAEATDSAEEPPAPPLVSRAPRDLRGDLVASVRSLGSPRRDPAAEAAAIAAAVRVARAASRRTKSQGDEPDNAPAPVAAPAADGTDGEPSALRLAVAARAEASRIRADAEAEAARIVDAATAEAARITGDAAAAARRAAVEARDGPSEELTDAAAEAARLRAEAAAEATRIRAEAEAEATRIRAAAEAEATRVKTEAEEAAARIRAEAGATGGGDPAAVEAAVAEALATAVPEAVRSALAANDAAHREEAERLARRVQAKLEALKKLTRALAKLRMQVSQEAAPEETTSTQKCSADAKTALFRSSDAWAAAMEAIEREAPSVAALLDSLASAARENDEDRVSSLKAALAEQDVAELGRALAWLRDGRWAQAPGNPDGTQWDADFREIFSDAREGRKDERMVWRPRVPAVKNDGPREVALVEALAKQPLGELAAAASVEYKKLVAQCASAETSRRDKIDVADDLRLGCRSYHALRDAVDAVGGWAAAILTEDGTPDDAIELDTWPCDDRARMQHVLLEHLRGETSRLEEKARETSRKLREARGASHAQADELVANKLRKALAREADRISQAAVAAERARVASEFGVHTLPEIVDSCASPIMWDSYDEATQSSPIGFASPSFDAACQSVVYQSEEGSQCESPSRRELVYTATKQAIALNSKTVAELEAERARHGAKILDHEAAVAALEATVALMNSQNEDLASQLAMSRDEASKHLEVQVQLQRRLQKLLAQASELNAERAGLVFDKARESAALDNVERRLADLQEGSEDESDEESISRPASALPSRATTAAIDSRPSTGALSDLQGRDPSFDRHVRRALRYQRRTLGQRLKTILRRINQVDAEKDLLTEKIVATQWVHRQPQVVVSGKPYAHIAQYAREQRRSQSARTWKQGSTLGGVLPPSLRGPVLDLLPPIALPNGSGSPKDFRPGRVLKVPMEHIGMDPLGSPGKALSIRKPPLFSDGSMRHRRGSRCSTPEKADVLAYCHANDEQFPRDNRDARVVDQRIADQTPLRTPEGFSVARSPEASSPNKHNFAWSPDRRVVARKFEREDTPPDMAATVQAGDAEVIVGRVTNQNEVLAEDLAEKAEECTSFMGSPVLATVGPPTWKPPEPDPDAPPGATIYVPYAPAFGGRSAKRANGGRALRPNRGLLTVADAGKRLEESLSSAQDALERRKRVVHTTVPRASGA